MVAGLTERRPQGKLRMGTSRGRAAALGPGPLVTSGAQSLPAHALPAGRRGRDTLRGRTEGGGVRSYHVSCVLVRWKREACLSCRQTGAKTLLNITVPHSFLRTALENGFHVPHSNRSRSDSHPCSCCYCSTDCGKKSQFF